MQDYESSQQVAYLMLGLFVVGLSFAFLVVSGIAAMLVKNSTLAVCVACLSLLAYASSSVLMTFSVFAEIPLTGRIILAFFFVLLAPIFTWLVYMSIDYLWLATDSS